ncbi:MAG TPA: hydroxysqualene dehydroxylase HpnE [Solirubrobacteraceae bacterium]|nr:hydroxysqualene dehydroxylase HpnE [Solirubrobacteraceae bacterium]
MSPPRAVVIGGGVAGITSALDLAARDVDVTLVEVRPRLGGAAYSFERDGLALDNGQHVFLRCCTAYRALLDRIGGSGGVELQSRLEIAVLRPGHPMARLRRSRLPAPGQLGPALLRYRHLSLRERLGVGRAALALGRVDPARDDETLGSWLAAHGQSPRTIANLWDLIALPTLNVPAATASLGLGAFVFQEGLLRSAAAGDIGIHRAPLGEIIGAPARRTLAQAGVDVRLRWRAKTVERAGKRFEVRGERDSLSADAVVLAVPHARAAAIVPSELRTAATSFEGLGSSPIVNVHVVYDRRVLDHRFAAGVETPVQYVFDRTPASWEDERQYIAVSLSGAELEAAMPSEELRQRYLPALAELLPRARDAEVLRFAVTREHAATFRAIPGTRALRPRAETSVPGFALAGAWTATDWPATLEGAARSGHAAASVAIEYIRGV